MLFVMGLLLIKSKKCLYVLPSLSAHYFYKKPNYTNIRFLRAFYYVWDSCLFHIKCHGDANALSPQVYSQNNFAKVDTALKILGVQQNFSRVTGCKSCKYFNSSCQISWKWLFYDMNPQMFLGGIVGVGVR